MKASADKAIGDVVSNSSKLKAQSTELRAQHRDYSTFEGGKGDVLWMDFIAYI
jgi:hypothetical protein